MTADARCEGCGSQVAEGYRLCPTCEEMLIERRGRGRARQRRSLHSGFRPAHAAILAGVVVIGIAVAFLVSGALKDDLSGPVTEVGATELCRAYKENAVAADERFKDEVLVVSGSVERISSGPVTGPTVTLAGGFMSHGVRCEFEEDQAPALARIRTGQSIRIRGRCTGGFVGVTLEHCRIER